jgi:hypothetical protein
MILSLEIKRSGKRQSIPSGSLGGVISAFSKWSFSTTIGFSSSLTSSSYSSSSPAATSVLLSLPLSSALEPPTIDGSGVALASSPAILGSWALSASCWFYSSSVGAGVINFIAISSTDLSYRKFLPIVETNGNISGTGRVGTSRLGFSSPFPLPFGGGAFLALGSAAAADSYLASSAFFSSSYFLRASLSSLAWASAVSFSYNS